MQKKFFHKPAIALLPFFIFYILLIIFQSNDSLFGDEPRYLEFANNFLHGFYSTQPPSINLWNGPGYPLFLLPFVALGIPSIAIKLFNAVLYYCVLLMFNKTLTRFLDTGKSIMCTVLFACYYMPYKSLPHMLSENLALFLIASIVMIAADFFDPANQKPGKAKMILLAALLAGLALTKVMFGQAYGVAAIAFILLFFFTGNVFFKKSFFLILLALLFCSPYLVYTYSLTGKIFYWSNAGGMSLYWMSNPIPGEWGEWHNDSLTSGTIDENALLTLRQNHLEEYKQIHAVEGVERDNMFKAFAWKHISEHPGKFALNWIANWSRMFFNYPVSYKPVSMGTIGNMLANIPVLILMGYASLLTWRNRKKTPFVLKFLLIISGIYLVGCSFFSAYDRMFYILAPVIAFWLAYTFAFFRNKQVALQKSK